MARKTPILLRKSPLTERIQVITNYKMETRPSGVEMVKVIGNDGKHDVTADFDALVLEALLDDDANDALCTIDALCDSETCDDAQLGRLRIFHGRFAELVERHNTEGHGAKQADPK